jgi:hypothetical protein
VEIGGTQLAFDVDGAAPAPVAPAPVPDRAELENAKQSILDAEARAQQALERAAEAEQQAALLERKARESPRRLPSWPAS